MNKETKLLFNKNLIVKVYNCTDAGNDEFCNRMNYSAKVVAYEKHEENKGWFHHSRDLLKKVERKK